MGTTTSSTAAGPIATPPLSASNDELTLYVEGAKRTLHMGGVTAGWDFLLAPDTFKAIWDLEGDFFEENHAKLGFLLEASQALSPELRLDLVIHIIEYAVPLPTEQAQQVIRFAEELLPELDSPVYPSQALSQMALLMHGFMSYREEDEENPEPYVDPEVLLDCTGVLRGIISAAGRV